MVTKGFTASPLLQARLPCHDQKQVSLRAVVMREAFLMVEFMVSKLIASMPWFPTMIHHFNRQLCKHSPPFAPHEVIVFLHNQTHHFRDKQSLFT